MEFVIYRTSGRKEKPCEGAYFSTEKRTWIIEINSLEELLALDDSVECQIIFTRGSIELYDDFRE